MTDFFVAGNTVFDAVNASRSSAASANGTVETGGSSEAFVGANPFNGIGLVTGTATSGPLAVVGGAFAGSSPQITLGGGGTDGAVNALISALNTAMAGQAASAPTDAQASPGSVVVTGSGVFANIGLEALTNNQGLTTVVGGGLAGGGVSGLGLGASGAVVVGGGPAGLGAFEGLGTNGSVVVGGGPAGLGAFEGLGASGAVVVGGGPAGLGAFEGLGASGAVVVGGGPAGLGAFEGLGASGAVVVGGVPAGLGAFEGLSAGASSVVVGGPVAFGGISLQQNSAAPVGTTAGVSGGGTTAGGTADLAGTISSINGLLGSIGIPGVNMTGLTQSNNFGQAAPNAAGRPVTTTPVAASPSVAIPSGASGAPPIPTVVSPPGIA